VSAVEQNLVFTKPSKLIFEIIDLQGETMKIYTGGGDRGKTSLFSGERVPKTDDRIEAYGDVDELSSVIGALIAALPKKLAALTAELQHIQSDLFYLSSWLATTPGSSSEAVLEEFTAENVKFLENAIDRIDEQLPALKDFILPGGHVTTAWAHIARTVCRRAERRVFRVTAEFLKTDAAGKSINLPVYLNRLSDYLFLLARYCNQIMGVSETRWKR
jgi:cob(I)alamin adenosyltransferase